MIQNNSSGIQVYVKQVDFGSGKTEKQIKEEKTNEVDKALHILKKLMEKEQVIADVQKHRYYQKPSEKKRERMKKAKRERKRLEAKRNKRNRY